MGIRFQTLELFDHELGVNTGEKNQAPKMGVLEQVLQLKDVLVKADNDGDTERLKDVLKELAAVDKITEAVVKKSRAGKTLKDMKSSYEKKGEKEIASTIVDILKAWTKMAKQGGGKKATAASTSSSSVAGEGESKAPSSSAPVPAPMGEIAPHRQKIVTVLSVALKGKAHGENTKVDAEYVARVVESLINAKSPYDEDNFKNNTEYTSKVRSLVFNIKKNGDLANAILGGAISPSELVVMSPDDLADEAVLKKRREIAESDTNARRTDWLDVNKASILANCGVEEDENVMKLEEEVQSESDDDG